MPDWLPDLIPVNSWPDFMYDVLYKVFCKDIRDVVFRYFDHEVWFYRDREDGKEAIFWHLTSKKPKPIPRRKKKFYPPDQTHVSPERLPDLPRCARLRWVRPITEHADDPSIQCWDYLESNRKVHTYVWLKDHDFVVIFQRIDNGSRRLITSFYIDYENKRIDLEEKYMNRIT